VPFTLRCVGRSNRNRRSSNCIHCPPQCRAYTNATHGHWDTPDTLEYERDACRLPFTSVLGFRFFMVRSGVSPVSPVCHGASSVYTPSTNTVVRGRSSFISGCVCAALNIEILAYSSNHHTFPNNVCTAGTHMYYHFY
jgi:hypothetical protein